MTTATMNQKAEKIKENIKETAEKSKETIREIIDSNTKYIGDALDTNKKVVDSIKVKLNQQNLDDTFTDTLKSTFGKSIELAEDTLDSIINSYMTQAEMNVDFNLKLVEALKGTNGHTPEKVLTLIQENFEAARELNTKNTKELVDAYNKHTNLVVNFNKKMGENMNSQIESMFNLKDSGMNKFNEWASVWWKQAEKTAKN